MAAPHAGMSQLINGNFQDANGDALNLGYIIMQLNQDAQSSQQSQVDGGRTVKIQLDATGNAVAGQYVWPNTALNPSNTFYIVNVYSAAGQLVWGPNYLLVNTTPNFDLDSWVPNQIGTGGTPAGSIVFQTNGVNNGSQQLLDLQQGTNVTLVDSGSGQVTISASGGGGNGPRKRNWRGWTTDGADALTPATGQGCTPSSTGTLTGITPTATTPMMVGLASGAGAGTLQAFLADGDSHSSDGSITLGTLGIYETQMSLIQLLHTRVWIGLGNGVKSGANFWKSDAPPEPTIGFRYSSNVPDTNFQCVVTDGTTQLTTNSGIIADTNAHIFAIEFSAPNVLFFIDGAQVASIAISTTTLTSASLFQGFFTIDNVASANNVTAAITYNYWDTNV